MQKESPGKGEGEGVRDVQVGQVEVGTRKESLAGKEFKLREESEKELG